LKEPYLLRVAVKTLRSFSMKEHWIPLAKFLIKYISREIGGVVISTHPPYKLVEYSMIYYLDEIIPPGRVFYADFLIKGTNLDEIFYDVFLKKFIEHYPYIIHLDEKTKEYVYRNTESGEDGDLLLADWQYYTFKARIHVEPMSEYHILFKTPTRLSDSDNGLFPHPHIMFKDPNRTCDTSRIHVSVHQLKIVEWRDKETEFKGFVGRAKIETDHPECMRTMSHVLETALRYNIGLHRKYGFGVIDLD